MSWSIAVIGKPENIVKKLEEYSEKFTDQTKVEFDSAKPHLIALVRENFVKEGIVPTLKIEANGHGYSRDGEQFQRQLKVSIESIYGDLV